MTSRASSSCRKSSGTRPYRSVGGERRLLDGSERPGGGGRRIEVANDLAGDPERVLVRRGEVVGDARASRVHVGAPELLRADVLPGRRLHERRAADEDRPRPVDDHRLVRHRRHVRAAGGAGAHHDRDLRDPERREARLVEEDAPEVVAVGEDLRLQREEGAAGVDEVEARQAVLTRNLLRTQVLLHGERVVRAALHRRVVRDDHALSALDDADPGDDPRRGRIAVVQLPRGERVELEEGGSRVDEPVDALARSELSARAVPLDRLLAATRRDHRGALAQLGDEALHRCAAPLERVVARNGRGEHPHGA